MTNEPELTFGVAAFIAYLNQTLETAYPFIHVEGELSNFRISKNRWVYFDLKDEAEPAVLKCFAVIYALPGPLEDGMRVRISGSPRLHPLYNFSFQVQQISPVGEGSLKKAADLLRAKLEAEGLFEQSRKRFLPAFPRHIALITAGQSAAYADFIKITSERWGNLTVEHYDVLVQGEESPRQIVAALESVNASAEPVEAIVLIRGGGSAEDLAAFNDERVVRAVAASRIPTLVAIGHEIDVSLAELAADVRASTPSNAAELLVPDRGAERRHLETITRSLDEYLSTYIAQKRQNVVLLSQQLDDAVLALFDDAKDYVCRSRQLLSVLDPHRPLTLGYALIRIGAKTIRSVSDAATGDAVEIELADGTLGARIEQSTSKRSTHDKNYN